jgi:CheY-like chemotaxis protein
VTEPFDAVLLDMQMPDMDGRAAARRMRADPATSDVPLIAITSLSRGRRDSEGHFAAVLSKPVKHTQLLEVLAGVAAARPEARRRALDRLGQARRGQVQERPT